MPGSLSSMMACCIMANGRIDSTLRQRWTTSKNTTKSQRRTEGQRSMLLGPRSILKHPVSSPISVEISNSKLLAKLKHATYYGYQETHGRVSGLCFKRYTASLLETVNPQRLNKVAFRTSGREIVKGNMQCGLQGLLAGIKHLHSLGLVHNDVNPANIMLGDDRLVLIDFDSCRSIGQSLRDTNTKRTPHWHDPSVEISLEKNDLDAFKELKIWLTGSLDDDFLFE